MTDTPSGSSTVWVTPSWVTNTIFGILRGPVFSLA
jgi:hypothetical protein